uniref:Uncharacterized protein n=1 Tax=Scleropages formosus TaxID=113540 RepID=A0A8C9VLA8_SCLFO
MSVAQQQKEVGATAEQCGGQGGNRRQQGVIPTAQTEHGYSHLICITQWLVALPVGLPVSFCAAGSPGGAEGEHLHVPERGAAKQLFYVQR